jgi:GR25 family glycosyltransferase involved in LPS biosynthesis
MGKIFNNDILCQKTLTNYDWKNSFIKILKDNKIIIKNNYTGYYNNLIEYNERIWKNKCLYNEIIPNYNMFNGIDHIVWINLDRCNTRRDHMIKLLSNIPIPNTRISAIDGKNNDFTTFDITDRPMNNYEIATTLSHIKACNYLKDLSGDYFCICEDDILLNNMSLMNIDLKKIISEAPPFDILLLYKTYNTKLTDMYTKWREDIYGACCYIISRKGIQKICSYVTCTANNNFNFYKKISIADFFLYNYVDSFVYKYNFVNTIDQESLIHPEHIQIHQLSSLNQLELILEDNL